MRRFLLSALALGGMMSAAQAGHAASSGPGRAVLTDPQMDAVTAGLAGIATTADAVATGDRTFTETRTRAISLSTGGGGVGAGYAVAVATGSESHDVETGVQLVHGGAPLIGQAITVEQNTPILSIGTSIGLVIDQ